MGSLGQSLSGIRLLIVVLFAMGLAAWLRQNGHVDPQQFGDILQTGMGAFGIRDLGAKLASSWASTRIPTPTTPVMPGAPFPAPTLGPPQPGGPQPGAIADRAGYEEAKREGRIAELNDA